MIITIGLLLIALTYLFVSFALRFTVIRVSGVSMLPTLKDGQILFIDRYNSPNCRVNFWSEPNYGKIMVYCSPEGEYVVKRLHSKLKVSDSEFFYWFEGDNKEESCDSRTYGFVHGEMILGEVVNFPMVLKLLLFMKREN